MSFESREITVIFNLNAGDFGEGNNELTVSGLRVEAQIENAGGVFGNQLYAKIYGMKEVDMLKICSYAQYKFQIKTVNVTLMAGDDKSGMSQVFQGTLFNGMIDYNEMPSVPMVIQAGAAYAQQVEMVAPNSAPGVTDVATLIGSLAKSIGFSFEPNDVKASLSNHYSYGSAIQQIQDIARSASINLDISNRTVAIWPRGASRNAPIVNLSPQEGLIGYPVLNGIYYIVNSSFFPDMVMGRMCRLTTSVARASGDFFITKTSHLISSNLPGGPWMTTTQLSSTELLGQNQ